MRRLAITLAVVVGAVFAAAPQADASAMQPYYNLKLKKMPETIHDCSSCGHKRAGAGPLYDCLDCWVNCNCLVGGFTDPGGQYWDGKYYPGVPQS